MFCFFYMKKNIWLFIGLSMLFIGSFAYWASCGENAIEVWNECYCKEWFTWNTTKTECVAIDTSLRDAELKKAIERMYDNWLTQYNTLENFWSEKYLTREQAAKFFATFYSKVLNKKFNENINSKIFSDMDKANPDLKYYVFRAYNMWLFKWFKWRFMPTDKLTQAQAISVAIRMLNWDLEEVKNAWYINYYTKARRYGLLKYWDFDIIDWNKTNITRWDMALILYALYKHVMNNKDDVAANYNYDLTKSINKCLVAEEDNIAAFESGTEEDMYNSINKILDACKESAEEIHKIWIIEENDSLQNAMLNVVYYNVLFFNKAKEIVPYKRIENLTETQEIESNKISEVLEDLIIKFDASFENLKAVQKEFAKDYGFSIE